MESINNIVDFLGNIVNQYIVRPTGLPNLTGVAGYVFDILGEEEVFVDSEITDHYVEDNYAIQDHIALRPIRFILRGYVGELTDNVESAQEAILTLSHKLSTIAGYLPELATQSEELYTEITANKFNVGEVVNQAISTYNLFSQSATSANKQQNAYNYFYNLWVSRILCSVETPFRIFTNMAIESIRARQDEATRYISDFSITFKQIRTSQTIKYGTIEPSAAQTEGPLLAQSGRVADMFADFKRGSQTSGASVDTQGNTIDTIILLNSFRASGVAGGFNPGGLL
jgi:hypothetical protein